MFPKGTPPPKGWIPTHDLRQKQLVQIEDTATFEMRFPDMQPREIPASHFSVHAFVLSGQTPSLVPNLFTIDPKSITSTHEKALENYFENLSKDSKNDSQQRETQPAETVTSNTSENG